MARKSKSNTPLLIGAVILGIILLRPRITATVIKTVPGKGQTGPLPGGGATIGRYKMKFNTGYL